MAAKGALETQEQLSSSYSDEATKRWLNRITSNPDLVVDLLLIAFVVTYSLVGMRNFDLRMATLHEDDGPIFYARAFRNLSLFEGDFPIGFPLSQLVPVKVVTSAMVWIPALLWRYLHIDPYPTTWLITLMQGLLIGLSIYVLVLAIVRERVVAVLCVVFAYIAAPWSWTPANYGTSSEWNFLPYAAHLALGPVLLAFVCLLGGRNKVALLLLIVAGLIHPNLTLYACAIVGVYWLWEGMQDRSLPTLRRLVGLTVVGIIIILPALFVRLNLSDDPLSHAEIMAGMRQNQHIWPWGYEGRWNFSLQTTLKWLALAALSWRWRAEFSSNVRRLWLAALVGVVLIGLSHVAGGVWQIPMLLNLIGLRSFVWLGLISLPLVMYYWYAHIRSGSWLGAVLSLLCLALPLYAREYALFWSLIVGLLLVDVSQGHLAVWSFDLPAWGRYVLRVMALLVLVTWSISFLAMPFGPEEARNPLLGTLSELTWGVMGALPAQPARITLVVAIALVGLMAWGFGRLVRKASVIDPGALWRALICLTIVLYGARFWWVKWQEAENQRVSSLASMLDVQLWAREHTPTSSLFVIPSGGGWRTMSLRRKLSPFTRESYAYVASRQATEHRDRLLDFYGISAKEAQELQGSRIYEMEQDRFWNFEESDFLRFASEFGATHLVLPTHHRYTGAMQFVLPLAYQNLHYVVYHLEEPHFDKIYSLPFDWRGPDTIHVQDLAQTAPPLRISGYRGDFAFSRISVEDGDVIRVSPVLNGASESKEKVIQFGWWLEDKGDGLQIPPGHIVYLSLWVRLSTLPKRAELFIQDQIESWEKSSVPMGATSWQRYTVVKKMRIGATAAILGVVWQPKAGEEWLEMKDMRVFVVPP